jgi:hypothetical protein
MKVRDVLRIGAELYSKLAVNVLEDEVFDYFVVKISKSVLASAFIFKHGDKYIGILNGWTRPLREVDNVIKCATTYKHTSKGRPFEPQMILEDL